MHPIYKFFAENDEAVFILNSTVAEDPVPKWTAWTELSKILFWYILQDEKEHELGGMLKYYVITTGV